MRRMIVVLTMAGASWACAAKPSPIPVVANAADLSQLAGEWAGNYTSPETGRSGSITFKLGAGKDSAFGDVLMVPSGATQALVPADRGSGAQGSNTPARSPQVLTIRFVRVEGGRVSGTLDPYRSPDCECTLTTTFSGELRGDTIEGSFVTRGTQLGAPQTGRWKVTRREQSKE